MPNMTFDKIAPVRLNTCTEVPVQRIISFFVVLNACKRWIKKKFEENYNSPIKSEASASFWSTGTLEIFPPLYT